MSRRGAHSRDAASQQHHAMVPSASLPGPPAAELAHAGAGAAAAAPHTDEDYDDDDDDDDRRGGSPAGPDGDAAAAVAVSAGTAEYAVALALPSDDLVSLVWTLVRVGCLTASRQ
jgi:hypothetical protein